MPAFTLSLSGQKPLAGTLELNAPSNLYRVATDADLHRTDRAEHHYPMVFWLEDSQMPINEAWQKYLCHINPGMEPRYVAELLGSKLAFCNGTGFGEPGDPRADFIRGENVNDPLPRFSKVYTCGGAVVEYAGELVKLMDGSRDPDFSVTPQSNPELFFAAVTADADGNPHPFINGALYPWYMQGRTPVSFLPHVRRGGSVAFPPRQTNENTATLIKA